MKNSKQPQNLLRGKVYIWIIGLEKFKQNI